MSVAFRGEPGNFFEWGFWKREGRGGVGCRGVVRDVLGRINNRRGVRGMCRYTAELHFRLGSRAGTGSRTMGTVSKILSVMGNKNRCRVMVKRRMTSICGRLRAVVKAARGRVRLGSTGRFGRRVGGGGVSDRFVSIVDNIFAPMLKVLATANIVGKLLTFLTTAKLLTAASKACRVLGVIKSYFFGFLPVFLKCASVGGFNKAPFVKVTVKTTLMCPSLAAVVTKSTLCALFDNAVFRASMCMRFLKVPILLVGCTDSMVPMVLAYCFTTGVRGFFTGEVDSLFGAFTIPTLALLVDVVLTFLVVKPVTAFTDSLLNTTFATLFGLGTAVSNFLCKTLVRMYIVFKIR